MAKNPRSNSEVKHSISSTHKNDKEKSVDPQQFKNTIIKNQIHHFGRKLTGMKIRPIWFVLVLVFPLTFFSLRAVQSQGISLTVNSTNDLDDGACDALHCSLREALNAANSASGYDSVVFAIPGNGPYTIQPTSELPAITEPVLIDGASQPGYSGTPLIELDGVSAPVSNGLVLNAGGSTIRGLVINRFQFDGISINTTGSNILVGNYLGTDRTGMLARPNRYGIYIYNASNNQIGGVTTADRNIISGNRAGGVYIIGTVTTGGNNTIQGNVIGLAANGTSIVANEGPGIIVSSPDNTVGGTVNTTPNVSCTGACNVISGNQQSGILLAANAANTLIQGNYIGTDSSGMLARANQKDGVEFNGATTGNKIGGTTRSARNIISANTGYGIAIHNNPPPQVFTIQGNYIGLNAAGTAALGNKEHGIYLSGGQSTIGGTELGAGNVISGNQYYGIEVDFGSSFGTSTIIQGNYVGTDYNGTSAVPNQQGIVVISLSKTVLIGGTETAARNVISGNQFNGIIAGLETTVIGNYIGVDSSGYKPLGNGGYGVEVETGQSARIGRPVTGGGNVIAYNGDDGVSIRYGVDFVGIAGNSIYANGGVGVDLRLSTSINDNGVTLNDPGDTDSGANQAQNYPVINTVTRINNQTTISGSLGSNSSTNYRLDFYANATCDTSGFGEGERYLGYTTLSTDSSGNATFSAVLTENPFVGDYVTATATRYSGTVEQNNRTSEFSTCRRLLPPINFAAPSELTNQTVSQTYAVVSWKDNTSDEVSFYLERSPNGLTNWTQIGNIRSNATRYWVTDLACNSVGYYRVRALRSDGQYSYPSNVLMVNTQPCSQPATHAFLVNNTNDFDDGICNIQNCTLREAINAANANSATDIIVFNFSSAEPYVIQPLQPLPGIESPLLIDGTSQPGYTATPIITINGDLVPPAPQGQESTRAGIKLLAGNSTVQGLAINGWDYSGISIVGAGSSVITGNYIGTNSNGTAPVSNRYGIVIYESSNNLIGGTSPAARNLISGNLENGIQITGSNSHTNQVFGNIIGLDAVGNSGSGNGQDGIYIEGAQGSLIGDTPVASRNIIAANMGNGLIVKGFGAVGTKITNNYVGTDTAGGAARNNALYAVALEGTSGVVVSANLISGGVGIYGDASSNYLYGNTIGTNVEGSASLAGTINGIVIENANGNVIGDMTSPNLISGVSQTGIRITGTSIQNRISNNHIFGNGGLGIDLGGDGVTANDIPDSDIGANKFQNYPTLIAANTWQGEIYVRGTLQGIAGANYRLEFYMNEVCDASGYGEGQTFIAAQQVTISPLGDSTFTLRTVYNLQANTSITATVIDVDNNTSEFSACISAVAQPIPTPPAPPQLTSPADNLFSANTVPLLVWTAAPDATGYEIEIDNNSDFASVEQYQSLTGLSYQAAALTDGKYYWHVRSTNTAGAGSWSSTQNFTVDTLSPLAPTLNTPSDNSSTSNTQPLFTWSSVSDADHYLLRLGHTNPPVQVAFNGASTSFSPTFPLIAGTYYWQVLAVDVAGNVSGIMETRTLTINSPLNATPSLNYFTVSTPTLSWNRVSTAVTYEVQVDNTADFSTPLEFSITVPASILSVATTPLSTGTYYWHVRACITQESCGNWNATASFIVDIP
jgi:CSLREA domain-containing protein